MLYIADKRYIIHELLDKKEKLDPVEQWIVNGVKKLQEVSTNGLWHIGYPENSSYRKKVSSGHFVGKRILFTYQAVVNIPDAGKMKVVFCTDAVQVRFNQMKYTPKRSKVPFNGNAVINDVDEMFFLAYCTGYFGHGINTNSMIQIAMPEVKAAKRFDDSNIAGVKFLLSTADRDAMEEIAEDFEISLPGNFGDNQLREKLFNEISSDKSKTEKFIQQYKNQKKKAERVERMNEKKLEEELPVRSENLGLLEQAVEKGIIEKVRKSFVFSDNKDKTIFALKPGIKKTDELIVFAQYLDKNKGVADEIHSKLNAV